ncbi:MAG: hypothetical protein WKF84_06630 [Pyrinomonadaceae bacterium]
MPEPSELRNENAERSTHEFEGSSSSARHHHPSFAEQVTDIKTQLGREWIPTIYRERVLTLRTRSHLIGPATKNARIEVQRTLLGVELKIGRRRLQCPDVITARYLAVYAQLGCPEVAVPYDITKVSRLADDLESSWHRICSLADLATLDRPQAYRRRLCRTLIAQAASEVNEAGPGAKVPQFVQNTKQRPVIPHHVA